MAEPTRRMDLQLFAEQDPQGIVEVDADPGEDTDFPDDDDDNAQGDVADVADADDAEPEDDDSDEPSAEPQTPKRSSHWRTLKRQHKETQRRLREYEQLLDDLAGLAGVDRQTLLQQVQVAKALYGGGNSAQTAAATTGHGVNIPSVQTAAANTQQPDPTLVLAQSAYQRAQDAQYALEAAQLKQDPLYADIDQRLPVVKQVAQRYGINLKQAYNMLYADEVAKRAEQRALENARTRAGLRAEQDFGVQEPTQLGLERDEYEAAVKLGFDPRVYAALKKATNLDEYEKLLSRSRRRK